MKMFRVVVNGNEYKVEIEELADGQATPAPASPKPTPVAAPKAAPAAKPAAAPKAAQQAAPGAGGAITAPMPGTILSVSAAVGDKVEQGQVLLVLEAMKMENEIMAPSAGTVEQVNATQGESVNAGDTLIVISA